MNALRDGLKAGRGLFWDVGNYCLRRVSTRPTRQAKAAVEGRGGDGGGVNHPDRRDTMKCMLDLHGITFDLPRIADACRRAGVVRLYLFGSILTDRFRADSDIDLLIETDPRHPVGLFALGGLQMDLAELLGRTVHLTMLGGVPKNERPAVLARARMLDAA